MHSQRVKENGMLLLAITNKYIMKRFKLVRAVLCIVMDEEETNTDKSVEHYDEHGWNKPSPPG